VVIGVNLMATESEYESAEEKILANIADGAKRVRYADGREIEYITDASILQKVADLKTSASSPFVKVGLSGRSI
jgi:hypothetical protein